MRSSLKIKRKSIVLARRYHDALRQYITKGQSASLRPALKLGRQAVAMGLEILDLALIHEQALIVHTLPMYYSTDRDHTILRAGMFFAEAILPMEETHNTAVEANLHLSRLNGALSRRTEDLDASNRQLKKEIIRRQVVENRLRQSEQHSITLLDNSRTMQEQLRLLSRRILSVQEEERKRISRELHDVIAQMLTGINVRLATLKIDAKSNNKDLSDKISRTQRLVEKSVDIVHQFARELRPAVLDHLGLIPALHSFMKTFAKETGIQISLTAFKGLEELSSSKRTALYRVAQEALTNVARHAEAGRVDVTIKKAPNAIVMQITDNGKSFDSKRSWSSKKSQHLGLLGMRERVEMVGGRFTVESTPGKGTTIHAKIPFKNHNNGH
ncbi:MAG: hypothetical protein A2283_14535 [Lentisphaerae bacterium RIFOXYA12_FULL_48_11]|nr:MAG: hypothetical protein A2283_14535 [Lentisphaerae bacterium RIFOXYA12_FULL_48_11]